jgi:cysteine desulfurase
VPRRVYLDHVASSPLAADVRRAMDAARDDAAGNPSSLHAEGRRARDLLEGARDAVAKALGARPREVVFTAGGTESCDLGLRGAALARAAAGKRVVVTAVEHSAVLDPAAALAEQGFDVRRVPPAADGSVDPDAVAAACGDGPGVASVMLANHETGAVLAVRAVADAVRPRKVLLHCDATIAPGRLDVRPETLGVDLLSLSGHKIHGPKGIGVLWVRRGTKLEHVRRGGIQEERLRPGTEDVVAAVGFATAFARATASRAERAEREGTLSGELERGLLAIPGVRLVGPAAGRLPGLVNVEVEGCEGESLVVNLDLQGVAASTGSACAIGALEPSPVLLAMGFSKRRAASTVRFSTGEETTLEDVRAVLGTFPALVERLRSLAR